jgi:flap endonuclease-1
MIKFFFGDNYNNRGNFSIGRCKGMFAPVDALNRIYKQSIGLIANSHYNIPGMNDNNLHILSTFIFTVYMLKYGMLPIFVFDGKCPKEKRQTVLKRKSEKKLFKQKCDDIEDKNSPDFIKNFKKGFSISKEQIDECKHLLDMMGLKYVNAPEEADQQCASLAYYYKNDSIGVVSDDWDILMYNGTSSILKDFSFKNVNNTTIKVEKNDLLNICLIKANEIRQEYKIPCLENFTNENFLDFCILMGTDYTVEDKIFKIDNITHEELFEICALNNFDMDLVSEKLENDEKINSKEEFMISIKKIREIYNDAKIINPSDIDIIPSSMNNEKIIDYLCNEKGIDKFYVETELKNIDMSYFALKKIAESLKNPRSFSNLKSYQYKHYCEQYKKNIYDGKTNNFQEKNEKKYYSSKTICTYVKKPIKVH